MIEMKQDKISLKNGFDKFIVHCKVKNLSDMTIRYYKDGYGFFTTLYFLMEEGDLGYFKIKLIVQTQENKKLYTDKEIENNIISKYNKQRRGEKTGAHLFRQYYAKNYIQNGGII